MVVEYVAAPAGCPDAENDTGAELPVRSDAPIVVAVELPGVTTALDEEGDSAKVVGTPAAEVVKVKSEETLRFPLASREAARK